MKNRHRRIIASVLVIAVAAAGCAYYNTLYNAKKSFSNAQKQTRDRDDKVTRQAVTMYDEVIEKCRKMIVTWPDSRHVDDAMLLIGQSYYASDRFEECVGIMDTLTTTLPDTELMPRALALKGAALKGAEDYEQAVVVLEDRVSRFKNTPRTLFNLCTSLMSLDRSEDAVRYLGVLEDEFPDSDETLDARISIAEILAEKEQYDESRDVYVRLNEKRIPESVRYRVWMGYAGVDVALERPLEALATLDLASELVLTTEEEPPMLLLRAEALQGADSLGGAIKAYKDVAARFSRGEFAATAYYRLGSIYEEMDSLAVAKGHYESVSSAYANSEFARESIKRGNNLSQLLRLQQTADDDSPEAMALRQFSLAELQLFQFEDPDKALEVYEKLLEDYPDTEFAPRAAYAVGYIYGVLRADTTKAIEMYNVLLDRYPRSQQAAYADQFVIGAWVPSPPPPPPAEADSVKVDAGVAADTTATAVADTTGAGAATAEADTTATAAADTTGAATVEADTSATAVADTTGAESGGTAEADTSATAAADTTGADAGGTAEADTTDADNEDEGNE